MHCVGFLRPMVWLRQLRGYYYLGRVGVEESKNSKAKVLEEGRHSTCPAAPAGEFTLTCHECTLFFTTSIHERGTVKLPNFTPMMVLWIY